MAAIDRDGLVAFAQALVREPSVHDPANGRSEHGAAQLVAEQMRRFGWEPTLEEVAPGRPNVVAVVEGGRPGPTLLFEGHTDVVTEGARELWSVDPFAGEIRDGRLYGRGSADMKGGVAAMLYATAALAAGGPFPGRVVLAALVDEEGLMLGVKRFVAGGGAAGVDAAIVCEPEAGEVCIAQKGAVRLRVDAHGRMAHGAMPDHGRNPVPALAELAGAVAAYEAELQRTHGEHPQLGRPFVTPTVLQAGSVEQLNVVPAHAWLGLDVRTVPGQDHEELIARVRDLTAAVAARHGVRAELTVIDDRPATEVAEHEPVVRAVVEAHEAITGERPAFGGVPGTTDGTILWRDAGLPVVVYGPGGKWIAHQADEHLELDELVRAAEVYVEAARRFLWGGRVTLAPGPHNALTDVPGIEVGHATLRDPPYLTGTTVVLARDGAVGGVDVRGGGPGTRETDLLEPRNLVSQVHAVVLSGGSAYGLDAAGGVVRWLEQHGIGFRVGAEPGAIVPIVPAAVLFDLGRGGAFHARPDAETGYAAAEAASAGPPAQGCVGAGTGAVAGGLKGGIGTASAVLESGATVSALVALNAHGDAVDPGTGLPYGAFAELAGEFGAGLRHQTVASPPPDDAPRRPFNTTLGVVATDLRLDKAQAQRLAAAGQAGLARAVRPAHTLFDGDAIFALATGRRELPAGGDPLAPLLEQTALHAAAADAVTRAVVHALLAAEPLGGYPAYGQR